MTETGNAGMEINDQALVGVRSAKVCWDQFLPRSLIAVGWASAEKTFFL